MFNFNIDDEAFKAFKYELISEVKKRVNLSRGDFQNK